MRDKRHVLTIIGICALTGILLGSCGKSEEKQEAKPASNLVEIARVARGGGLDLAGEAAYIKNLIEGAGFETTYYGSFPGQPNGKKGRVLLYESADGKGGGVIYITKSESGVAPCWHWYFEDLVPDSAVAVELNDDGLWDVRLVFKDGRVLSFIQDESFTLAGKGRSDWIALNGVSSPPVSRREMMWYCFDSDTSTVWSSPAGVDAKPYLEIPAPFGVSEGILVVRTLDDGQPKTCVLYADGERIQEFELAAEAARQTVELDSAAQGTKMIRLEFVSMHGGASAVTIAELSIR